MPDESTEKTKWFSWRAILISIVAGLGAAWCAIEIWTSLSAPSAKITADTQIASFMMPAMVGDPSPTPMIRWLRPLDATKPCTYMRIVLKNNGRLPAEKVTIKSEGKGVCKIVQDDGTIETKEYTHKITLGNLASADRCVVEIWEQPARDVSEQQTVSVSHDKVSQAVVFPHFTASAFSITSLVVITCILAGALASFSYIVFVIREAFRSAKDILRHADMEIMKTRHEVEEMDRRIKHTRD